MAASVASSSSTGERSPARKASTREQASPCQGVSVMGIRPGSAAGPLLPAPPGVVHELAAHVGGHEVQVLGEDDQVSPGARRRGGPGSRRPAARPARWRRRGSPSAAEQPVKATRFRTPWSMARLLPARVPSASRTPVSSIVHLGAAERLRARRHAERGDGVGDDREPLPQRALRGRRRRAGATWMPSGMSPTCSRSSVSATPASPGSRWCSGAIALNRCVTQRAPASTAGGRLLGGRRRVPERHDHAALDERRDHLERAGQVGRDRDQRDARVAGPPLDGVERRRAEQRLRVRAPLRRRQERPLEVQPERHAPAHPSGGPAASAARARSMTPSGVVTIVGSHAVTPNRGSSAPSSHSRSGSRGQVDAEPPVALQIDVPRRDEEPVELDRLEAGFAPANDAAIVDAESRTGHHRSSTSTDAPRRQPPIHSLAHSHRQSAARVEPAVERSGWDLNPRTSVAAVTSLAGMRDSTGLCHRSMGGPDERYQWRAERVGFEPTDPCGSTTFKAVAFVHSATAPGTTLRR